MKRFSALLICLLLAAQLHAATKDSVRRVIWAFPITSQITALKPGIKAVEVKTPPTVHFVQDKQVALIRGISRAGTIDTGRKGLATCHLIKGASNFFSVYSDSNATPLQEGDLLYTHVSGDVFAYMSPITYCAAHHITFLSVDDSAFFLPADFLKKRSKPQDDLLLERMVNDIHATGAYFLKQDSAKNLPVAEGPYKGKKVLDVMTKVSGPELNEFLRFVAAFPRRYAGNRWKISETFATWLIHGAPMVVPD